MPYIPHTEAQIKQMLDTIGVESIDDLFDEIPQELRSDLNSSNASGLDGIPLGVSEMQVQRFLSEKAVLDGQPLCFAGGGAYEHHIPAALWEIASRGEFYSAYTPYQAEASQGTLQVIYEYQSMIASLTAMDVSNASLYDGASGLAEAILMAVRANRKVKSKCILMPESVSPVYRQVVETIVKNQGIHLQLLAVDDSGTIDWQQVQTLSSDEKKYAALVIPQPNYFGCLEEVHRLTDWAHEQGALVIAQVNPMSLALLEAPGNWGTVGADIAVGEAQPLGIPLSSGGPYIGFMACKQKIVRQLPGRIVGRTVDLDGKPGFTLTLQAREQHIRRSKATSNICTNQGLMATAVTLYLALLGRDGLQKVATSCVSNTQKLIDLLAHQSDLHFIYGTTVFHEFIVQLEVSVDAVIELLAEDDIVAGIELTDNRLLICVTETKTEEELKFFAQSLITACDKVKSGVKSGVLS